MPIIWHDINEHDFVMMYGKTVVLHPDKTNSFHQIYTNKSGLAKCIGQPRFRKYSSRFFIKLFPGNI